MDYFRVRLGAFAISSRVVFGGSLSLVYAPAKEKRKGKLMVTQPILDRRLAYAMLRFTLGLDILMHGVVRLPNLGAFADGMVKQFAETLLPAAIVRPFALALVLAEVIVGLLLLLGLWTRWSLLLGAVMISSLVFGTALRSDWNTVAIQLLYAFIYAALISAREYNSYSVDSLISR
jgi:thiosulfate dehydrogenase [quinone] large subunit